MKGLNEAIESVPKPGEVRTPEPDPTFTPNPMTEEEMNKKISKDVKRVLSDRFVDLRYSREEGMLLIELLTVYDSSHYGATDDQILKDMKSVVNKIGDYIDLDVEFDVVGYIRDNPDKRKPIIKYKVSLGRIKELMEDEFEILSFKDEGVEEIWIGKKYKKNRYVKPDLNW